MAKAKILADRISITSEVLTDENLEKGVDSKSKRIKVKF